MNPDLYIPLVAAPVASLAVVLVGYIVQNQNLNARMAELRSDLTGRMADLNTTMNNRFNDSGARFTAELNATRTELRALIETNHSELLHKFADLDNTLTKLEHP